MFNPVTVCRYGDQGSRTIYVVPRISSFHLTLVTQEPPLPSSKFSEFLLHVVELPDASTCFGSSPSRGSPRPPPTRRRLGLWEAEALGKPCMRSEVSVKEHTFFTEYGLDKSENKNGVFVPSFVSGPPVVLRYMHLQSNVQKESECHLNVTRVGAEQLD